MDVQFTEISIPVRVLLAGLYLRLGGWRSRHDDSCEHPAQQDLFFHPSFRFTLILLILFFRCYSLVLLLRAAASSFLMSSSDNCGRSTLTVSLLSLPVKVNGH